MIGINFAPPLFILPIIALAGFAGGWTVQGWRCDAGKKDAVEAAFQAHQDAEKAANAKSWEAEVQFAKLAATNRNLSRRLEHAISVNPQCSPVPAHRVRLLDAALAGSDAPSEPDR